VRRVVGSIFGVSVTILFKTDRPLAKLSTLVLTLATALPLGLLSYLKKKNGYSDPNYANYALACEPRSGGRV